MEHAFLFAFAPPLMMFLALRKFLNESRKRRAAFFALFADLAALRTLFVAANAPYSAAGDTLCT
jgi:hypothetical protein